MLLHATVALLLLLLLLECLDDAAAAVRCLYPAAVIWVMPSTASQKHALGMQLHGHCCIWLPCMLQPLLLFEGCPGAAAAGPGAQGEPS
jgi:hypothetical protein